MADQISTATPIGWIGTGVMGANMAGHLLQAGFPLFVYNRSPEKALSLTAQGAVACGSPREVAERAEVVFSIVGFPADVRAVHLGAGGTFEGSRPGTILVDMTTSSPELARELAEQGAQRGFVVLDAPVSGGDVGARQGTLSIMVGGDARTFEYLAPVWARMGRTVVHQGAAGAGQHTKLVNQILIANNMVGVCEALLYAHRSGLNLEQVLQSVSSGAAGSWSLSQLAPRILQRNFAPGFLVDHFVKDMGLALDEAQRLQISLPGLALARQLYVALQAQGGGRLGTHALQLALAKISGFDW